jgi:hypothetical protein
LSIILTERGTKPRFLSPTALVDYAGNTFLAVMFNSGFDETTLVRLYKRSPGGVLSLVGQRQSAAGKEDSCCITLSGSTVLGFLTAHVGDPETNIQDFAFPGVAVAYPLGHVPLGAPGAYAVSSDPQPPGGTYPTAAEIALATVTLLDARMGGEDLRGDFEAKVKDALIELMDYNHDVKSQVFLNRLAPFIRDRCYEALLAYHGPRNAEDEDTLGALAAEMEDDRGD